MITVQAAEPALDPTLLALLSIFGGVLVTVVAGLIGALIQARREQDRWLRELRLKAITDSVHLRRRYRHELMQLTAVEKELDRLDQQEAGTRKPEDLASVQRKAVAVRKRIDVLVDDDLELGARLSVLGPDSLEALASAAFGAEPKEHKDRDRAFLEAARKVLGID